MSVIQILEVKMADKRFCSENYGSQSVCTNDGYFLMTLVFVHMHIVVFVAASSICQFLVLHGFHN